jgi:hypothetical protein
MELVYKFVLYVNSCFILWHVDPLLDNDREIRIYTTAVTRQRPVNSNRQTVFCAVSADML